MLQSYWSVWQGNSTILVDLRPRLRVEHGWGDTLKSPHAASVAVTRGEDTNMRMHPYMHPAHICIQPYYYVPTYSITHACPHLHTHNSAHPTSHTDTPFLSFLPILTTPTISCTHTLTRYRDVGALVFALHPQENRTIVRTFNTTPGIYSIYIHIYM